MRSACAASLYSQQDDAKRKNRKEKCAPFGNTIESLLRRQPRADDVGKDRGTCFVPSDMSRRQAALEWWSYNSYDSYECKGGSLKASRGQLENSKG